MTVPTDDPLSPLTDFALRQTQISLGLACGRSHSASKGNPRKYLCNLLELTKQESAKRGVVFPNPPYHAGDVKAPSAL